MIDIDQALARLDAGETVDFAYSNGLLRSSKEIIKQDDDLYLIVHGIDGTETYFSHQGIREVLSDRRSARDGDRDA